LFATTVTQQGSRPFACISDNILLVSGILVAELIPKIRNHLHRCVPPDHRAISPEMIQHVCQSQFWFNMVEAMRDQHSIERLTEELLRQLASQHISDEEAYWILWTLFNQSFKRLTVMR